MKLEYMMTKEVMEAKEKKLPLVIPVGTIEWHGPHCALGCDTFIARDLIEKLAEKKDIVVCPPVWYGVASYAVGGPENGTVEVNVDAFEQYMYCVLKSFLYGGFTKIYMVIQHQYEEENYMPMTLACAKAGKKLIMEYMEEKYGKGWWGSNSFSSYYDNLGGDADFPFGMIKVLPALAKEVQHATGYDHAGKYETSCLMALDSEAVKLDRLPTSDSWFIKSAYEANEELGKKMVELALKDLEEKIH